MTRIIYCFDIRPGYHLGQSIYQKCLNLLFGGAQVVNEVSVVIQCHLLKSKKMFVVY